MWLAMPMDWVELGGRWTHVTAAICWIGSSFYFIALDASLRQPTWPDPQVKGEAWQVRQIMNQAVITRAIPLDNLTRITDAERQAIASWIAAGARPD